MVHKEDTRMYTGLGKKVPTSSDLLLMLLCAMFAVGVTNGAREGAGPKPSGGKVPVKSHCVT